MKMVRRCNSMIRDPPVNLDHLFTRLLGVAEQGDAGHLGLGLLPALELPGFAIPSPFVLSLSKHEQSFVNRPQSPQGSIPLFSHRFQHLAEAAPAAMMDGSPDVPSPR